MTISISENSNSSPQWNKIFNLAHKGKKYELNSERSQYLSDIIKNKLLKNDLTSSNTNTYSSFLQNKYNSSNYLDEINFNDTELFKIENYKYFNETENALILSKEAYCSILNIISIFKTKLIEINENYENKSEGINDNSESNCSNQNDIFLKKKYDEAINFLYENLLKYTKKYIILDNGTKIYAIHEIEPEKKNTERSMTLIYISSGGLILDNCISKIDNMYINNTFEMLQFQVGKLKFQIKKSECIKNFSIIEVRNKILSILDNICLVEKEVDKNIKVLDYSINILNLIKKSINLDTNLDINLN